MQHEELQNTAFNALSIIIQDVLILLVWHIYTNFSEVRRIKIVDIGETKETGI